MEERDDLMTSEGIEKEENIDATTAEKNETEDNNKDYEDICYICRRPEHTAGKMLHMQGGICICSDCMQRTFDSMGSFNMNDMMSGGKMPNISMIDLSDLAGFFGGMPIGNANMDGMTGGIPNSQRLKKKKKEEKKEEVKETMNGESIILNEIV